MTRRSMSEYDLDLDEENSDYEVQNDKNEHESDEDTEDASETDMVKQEEEYTEIKEQMYQDKLANLKKQLQQLEDGIHPDYLKRLKKLEQNYQSRQLLNEVFERIEKERVEREYFLEREAAQKEFEEKKVELRENLISDLEEKKRIIEAERNNMELTGDKSSLQLSNLAIIRRLILEDSMEVKPVTTRKLRRRPNDPLPMPEKRRKTLPTQLNFLLDDNEILEDLRVLNKGKYATPNKRNDREIRSLHRQLYLQNSTSCESLSGDRGSNIDVKVEDGKLYYDKKCLSSSLRRLRRCSTSTRSYGTIEVNKYTMKVKKLDQKIVD